MKKKSKILNKLFTVFVAVLCMAMLCVPAFASSGTVILPETTFVFDEEMGGGFLEYELPLVVGQAYEIVWNGVPYICVCQLFEDDGGSYLGFAPQDIENPEFPFAIISFDGVTEFMLLNYSDLNAEDGTFTVTIYGDASGSPSIPVVNYTGTFTPSAQNDRQHSQGVYTPLVVGEKYLVTINGNEYIAIAESADFEGYTYLGLGDLSRFPVFPNLSNEGDFPFAFQTATGGGYSFSQLWVSSDYGVTEVTYTITNYNEPFVVSLFGSAGSVVTSLTSWVGSVARMVINTPVLLIGFTIGLATLAFGIFKGLKR